MFVDYHVHTQYSDDSDYPMEDVVKDAIELGMDEICFTDQSGLGQWGGDFLLQRSGHGECGLSGLCETDRGIRKTIRGSSYHTDGSGIWDAGAHDFEV